MIKQELRASKGEVTQFLEINSPEEAKLRKRIKEELDKETLENRNNLAKTGDIWGLIGIIPFDRLPDNRKLLALASENREKNREKDAMFLPTMRYETFRYLLRSATTPEEILRAIPAEWMDIKLPK
jgi:hypothetical protein